MITTTCNRALVSIEAPDAFPMESKPSQGYVLLRFADGTVEGRRMHEPDFHRLQPALLRRPTPRQCRVGAVRNRGASVTPCLCTCY